MGKSQLPIPKVVGNSYETCNLLAFYFLSFVGFPKAVRKLLKKKKGGGELFPLLFLNEKVFVCLCFVLFRRATITMKEWKHFHLRIKSSYFSNSREKNKKVTTPWP